MTDDLAADSWRLENIHRLDDARLLETEALDQRGQFRRAREGIEDGVQVVHRVTHLVQAVLLRLPQAAAVVERIGFEEKADLVAGLVEIAVVELGLFRRRKHVPQRFRIELVDELQRLVAQALAGLDRHEVLEDKYARRLEIGQHRIAERPSRRRLVCGNFVEYFEHGLVSFQTAGRHYTRTADAIS